eukprot:c8598_g1_i1.p1 GENE.c8598_g1_i1~~c8598_g1_i1.p1  ORF type:complete len:192 (-),score=45.91 c8598_g1_i1:13-588(-)
MGANGPTTIMSLQVCADSFKGNAEVSYIQAINTTRRHMDEACESQKLCLMQLGQQASQRLEAAKARAERSEPVTAHKERMARMMAERDTIERNIQSLANNEEAMRKEITNLMGRVEATRGKIAAEKRTESDINAQFDSTKQLYATIVGVVWDNNSSRAKGQVTSSVQGLQCFDFDPSLSNFEVCNRIWDLL